VRRFTLRNGLAVWLVESDRLPVVSASLVSRLGSAADPPDRPGLMSLAASTLDGGTTQRDALGLTAELEAVGATVGNDTGRDGTWLTASSLTTHAEETLEILADVVRNPTFPAEEVERVRDADIVALRQDRDDAETIAATVARREVYGAGHPYGHRTDGTEDGLRAATINDLRRAHAAAFTPLNTALLLSGDITEEKAKALAEQAFGSWGTASTGSTASSASGSGPSAPGAPAGRPERVLLVDKAGASQTALAFAAPGVTRADPDYERLLVLNQVFGAGSASRLNVNLRETRGYTYGAYSEIEALRGIGLVTISMAVQTDTTADAVRETLLEAETLTRAGVSPAELGRAKEYLSGVSRTFFDTNSSTLSAMRTLYLGDLPADYFQTRPGRLAGITNDDVTAVARRHLAPGDFTVVAVGDRASIEGPLRALKLGPVSLRSP
jgi:zinc protease